MERLEWERRDLLRDLAWVVSAVVLMDDAKRHAVAIVVEIA